MSSSAVPGANVTVLSKKACESSGNTEIHTKVNDNTLSPQLFASYVLPDRFFHPTKAVVIVYFALARVVRAPIAVEGWLRDGAMLNLIWAPEKGLTREEEMVTKAVCAYMVYTEEEALASGDEEDVGVQNDKLLRLLLQLRMERSFRAVAPYLPY